MALFPVNESALDAQGLWLCFLDPWFDFLVPPWVACLSYFFLFLSLASHLRIMIHVLLRTDTSLTGSDPRSDRFDLFVALLAPQLHNRGPPPYLRLRNASTSRVLPGQLRIYALETLGCHARFPSTTNSGAGRTRRGDD